MKATPQTRPERTDAEKEIFLRKDFMDTLRWLFVAVIAWKAAPKRNCCPHLVVMAMYTALERSRTLYEFFYRDGKGDDARAREFVTDWKFDEQSESYKKYMGPGSPINKRVSHLVWERDKRSGGVLEDESDHLKNQVLPCALDLLHITEEFIALVTPESVRAAANAALHDARAVAILMAKEYSVDNPFAK
jgi:hypothetical protein